MKAELKHISIYSLLKITVSLVLVFLFTGSALYAQDDLDDEGAVEIFWGDDEEDLGGLDFGDEEEFIDDEFSDDEFIDDEGFEFGDEDDLGFEDDFAEDEDLSFEDDFIEEEPEEDLSEIAQRMGYSINIAGSSPTFVNHQLSTYNSGIDFRISFELPMLMEFGPLRFRLGVEVGTFKFTNYKPIGGEYSGVHITGILSFPAGPGQVKVGGGLIGSGFGFILENSYGLTLGNSLDLRVGVRSTTAFGIKDSAKNDLGTVSWFDGLIIFGVTI